MLLKCQVVFNVSIIQKLVFHSAASTGQVNFIYQAQLNLKILARDQSEHDAVLAKSFRSTRCTTIIKTSPTFMQSQSSPEELVILSYKSLLGIKILN